MPQPLIIGHRGASAVAPENTIAAFAAAIDAGADGIEFDVRLSSDGVPVVIHDETLYRTVGVRRRVAEMSADQLSGFDVPSLVQLFELFKSNKLLLYLEIKGTENRLTEECCRLVEQHRLKKRVIFECFDHSKLQLVKSMEPAYKTAPLFKSSALSRSVLEKAMAIEADEIAIPPRLATLQLVEQAREAGIRIVTWTIDDVAGLKRARELGIHALITNDPAAMLAARDA